MLPGGLIAVNDDYRHRVVLISRNQHRIVWQYGHTDHPGRSHGFLNTPDGMDFLPYSVVVHHPRIEKLFQRNAPTGSPGAGGATGGPQA